MTWLITTGLTNALLASVLAGIAWMIGRRCRRPALTRLLWIVVLCKLLTPPLAKAPVGDWLPAPRRWLAHATCDVAQPVGNGDASRRFAADAAAEASAGDARTAPSSADRKVVAMIAVRTTSDAGARTDSAVNPVGLFQRVTHLSPAIYLRSAAAVWLGGSVLSLVWLACRAYRFRRFLARFARPDAKLSARVARLARDAGLASVPRVAVVESAVSPMLWGAGRNACLLFPAELTRRIDAPACDALLLHELAHYARGDWLVRLLELTAQVLYWWHPLVGCARREIEAAEEECCDAWVIHQVQSRRRYAEALLTTLDFLCEPLRPLPPAACGLGAVPLLRRRLTQIICGEVALQPSRLTRALVLTGAAIVLPLGPALVGPPREALARDASISVGNGAQGVPPSLQRPVDTSDAAPAAPHESKPGSWFVARGPRPRPASVVYACAVSPDGRHKLQARTGHRMTLVEIESEKAVDLSAYRIVSASFSPDSRFVATVQDDESVVRLWDPKTAVVQSLLKGSQSALLSVAVAPDGKHVAAGTIDGSVLVWDVEEQEVVHRVTVEDAPVSCLRWSKESDRLAIALGNWSDREVSSLAVWRPADGQLGESVPLESPAGAIDWLTADELLVADWGGEARTYDLRSNLPVERLWLGKDLVSAAAFSPDCRLLPRWQASVFQGGD